MKLTIKENHKDEILDGLKEQLDVALEAVGMQAETYAKMKCPVDTGLLRNSITHAVAGHEAAARTYHARYGSNRTKNGNRRLATAKNAGNVAIGTYSGTIGETDEHAVYVGTNVEYAPYVEYGTSHQDPQPFLKPAIMNHLREYGRILTEYLKK